MRRGMPEFAAIPLVIVLLGIVFAIMAVLDAGAVAMIVVGVIAAVAIVAGALIAMRRPRGAALGQTLPPFEGGATPPDDGVHRVLLVADSGCTKSELED